MTAVSYGLDVFSGNGAVDLAKARTEDGISFLFRKATEGATYDDPGFERDFDRCPSLDVQPGAYHFARPLAHTPQVEAAHFLKVLAGRRGLLALDLEDQDALAKLGITALAAWAGAWLSIVHDATGLRPFVYTYHSWAFNPAFAAIRAYPLWIPLDPSRPGEIVQAVHAVGTIGTLDVDTFLGTLDDLKQLAGLVPAQPATTPAPTTTKETDMARSFISKTPDVGDYLVSENMMGRWHIPSPDREDTIRYLAVKGPNAGFLLPDFNLGPEDLAMIPDLTPKGQQ